jgi:cell division protein FtsB
VGWPGRNGGGVPPGFPGSGGSSRPPRRVRPAEPPEAPAPKPPIRTEPPGRSGLSSDLKQPRSDSEEPTSDRPERKARLRQATHASVTRLATRWPGQGGPGAPVGFPGMTSTERRDVDGDGSRAGASDGDVEPDGLAADEPKTIVIRTNPLFRRSAAERAALRAELDDRSGRHHRLRRLREVAGRGPRKFNSLVAAVYAALGDPLVNVSEDVRARRAAQVRRAGTLAASAAVVVVLVYAIFPVRTYLDQRSSTQSREEELDVLSEANNQMSERAEELREQETVEEIARRDYSLIFPGEEPYAVLPAPTESTTTTTTAP